MTRRGKELLSVMTRCVVSSETSSFIGTFYLPAQFAATFVLEGTASDRCLCIPSATLMIVSTSVSLRSSVSPG